MKKIINVNSPDTNAESTPIYNSENTGGDSAVTKESCDYTNVSPAPITENETETAVESALASTPETKEYCYCDKPMVSTWPDEKLRCSRCCLPYIK